MTCDSGFPIDDYTPHGYLDLPTHTRRLNPKGVLRSGGIGFRWHFPALSTSYGGGREVYRSGLRVGMDGRLDVEDFDRVVAPYHSKNLLHFRAVGGSSRLDAEFHTVGDDVLCARIDARPDRELVLRVDYERLLSADHGWGESGLVGRRAGAEFLLQGFEDGDAFALWVSKPPVGQGITTDPGLADHWVATGNPEWTGDPVTAIGGSQELVRLAAVLTFAADEASDLTVLYARGRTASEAVARLGVARRTAPAQRAVLLAEDGDFWAGAPRLYGDWPEHWRRGLVYDLETLRTMVKQPVGTYRHVWDAMQIQAPRVVLGEAAIDALLLGYADPYAAQAMLLGVFVDAAEPNVPCSREDGSYNMVSADGSVCGTGPQWGYPWPVIAMLYDLRPDRDWLARIYPHCAAYLEWWLDRRRDADGWLVHACSWESGQDLSPRFGAQPLGGGHPTWTTRPVDLQAAFAQAAAAMAGWAEILDRPGDVERWRAVAVEYADRTERMWTGSRYADADPSGPTELDDVMLLAPVALGLAAAERVEALRPAIRSADPDSIVWPMFAWTAVDAAMAAGEYDTAARVAGAIVDRAYGFWDAPRQQEGRTMPGVSCEYWPLSGRCGGEGYGWGAFPTHLLLGSLLGIRSRPDGVHVRPNLPAELRKVGGRYGVRLVCRERPVAVELRAVDGRVQVDVNGMVSATDWGAEVVVAWDEIDRP